MLVRLCKGPFLSSLFSLLSSIFFSFIPISRLAVVYVA
jgi:hypothetical protein